MSVSYKTLSGVQKPRTLWAGDKPSASLKPKVLLIEDDRSMRRLVRAEISEHCDLIAAGNASLGASLFKTEKPDLTLIDIGLDDGNGHDLLKWTLTINPSAFVVMFSGYDDTETIFRAVEGGAKGFITKPFDIGKMMFFINQCKGV